MAAKSPMDAYMSRRSLPLAPLERKPIPREALSLTLADLLKRGDLPPDVRAWVERAARDRDWARANNPPGFVSDEGCWEKAKRAAGEAGADDVYAFATYWYGENCS